jgi:hypothetical protein
VATVWQRFDNFYLFGAVEPTTGDSFFLGRVHKMSQRNMITMRASMTKARNVALSFS